MTSPQARSTRNGWKWFHVTFSTYGTWLPGDPRGFRTRHHREHVEGDYLHPPPNGRYDGRHAAARERMTSPPVRLNPVQRRSAGLAMLAMFDHLGVTVVSFAVGAEHVHVVAKLPDLQARAFIARAKKHASHELRHCGLDGRVWAKRSRALPIENRTHQLNAMHYVERHRGSGAWVWVWGDPKPEPVNPSEPRR